MASSKVKTRYKDTLDQAALSRYEQKTSLIGVDPYEVDKSIMTSDLDSLPAISYYDIVNYLIHTKSAYTMQDLNSLKAMDALNQCRSGWVKDVLSTRRNDKILITGRVRHSQRMNETPLKPWIISSPEGTVDCAHCNCMAGLGEVCSHVGSLLFWIDENYRANKALTVTQKKAYWPVPSYVDKVPYSEIQDIDFTSTEVKKREFECHLSGSQPPKRTPLKMPEVPAPSENEISILSHRLFQSKSKPAVLAVKSAFQEHYVPDILREEKLPVNFSNLKSDRYIELERDELLKECSQMEFKVTDEQVKNAEFITKQQSKCKEWYALRHGRVTASMMKSVCVGSVDKPAISTVKQVCGTGSRFINKATKWGCDHESTAASAYANQMETEHCNFKCEQAGLFISKHQPQIGASPDGLVHCDCCGDGVIEIKCPFSAKGESAISAIEERVDFLENGCLKKDHRYYYQVQTQMFVTERQYCDFVVWTENGMSIERVLTNKPFQDEMVEKATNYFRLVLLPELLGSLISREAVKKTAPAPLMETSVSVNQQTNISAEIICVCRTPYGKGQAVIGCDGENCPFVWLHFKCINLKRVPKGSFLCDSCRKGQPKRQRKK